MKKITLATIKKFIRDNKENLYFKSDSRFDGMVDMVLQSENPEWHKVTVNLENMDDSSDLGTKYAYFVKDSRDSFREFSQDAYKGFYVFNCCGSFYLARKD